MEAWSSRRTFWLLWWTLGAVKLVLAARIPLFGDEAWYWLEGQHPAWAYSDLPGLTAWMARAGDELLGPSWLAVRTPFLLMGLAVPLVLQRAAAEFVPLEASWQVGVWALLLPLLAVLGPMALPDVPLTLAASLCLWAAVRLRRCVDLHGVVLLGTGLVLGALSHYRFALLLLAGGIGMLADPAARAALRQLPVQLALLAGGLAWVPLLGWNLEHAAAGLQFQFGQRHPWRWHADGVDLLASQVLVVGPLLLLAMGAALALCWRRWRAAESGPWALLGLSALVPLVVYALLGFVADRERVSFHWMLQAWMPLLLLLPVILSAWPRWLRRATAASSAALVLLLLGVAALPAVPAARLALADHPLYPTGSSGWSEIAGALRQRGAGADLVAGDFMLGAQLAFALRSPGLSILDHARNHRHGRAAQVELWRGQGAASGRWLVEDFDALPLRHQLAHYRTRCAQFPGLPSPEVVMHDRGRRRFLVFDLEARADDCRMPALAGFDVPVRDAGDAEGIALSGWAFKDGSGIDRIEVTLDGEVVAEAEYGFEAAHIAAQWPDSTDAAHPDVGFRSRIPRARLPPGEHWLGLILYGRDGSREPWPAQRLRLPAPD